VIGYDISGEMLTKLNKMQWEQICLTERKVDESIRSLFERGNVLDVYENAYGTPILYGWYFRKK
jgi:hypothetical protein